MDLLGLEWILSKELLLLIIGAGSVVLGSVLMQNYEQAPLCCLLVLVIWN
jgi:hypothetical protein